MLLMFGVGLHFSVRDLMNVKGIAVPGAVLQMFIATLLGGLVAHFVWGLALGGRARARHVPLVRLDGRASQGA